LNALFLRVIVKIGGKQIVDELLLELTRIFLAILDKTAAAFFLFDKCFQRHDVLIDLNSQVYPQPDCLLKRTFRVRNWKGEPAPHALQHQVEHFRIEFGFIVEKPKDGSPGDA